MSQEQAANWPALQALDWSAIGEQLNAEGMACLPGLLSPSQCQTLGALYPQESLFRNRVIMQRHGYGSASIDTSTIPCRR